MRQTDPMFPIRSTVATRREPFVTWALILVNCIVFLFEAGLDPTELQDFVGRFALVPARDLTAIGEGGAGLAAYLPFATNIFLHGGWLHLILNMWTLWLFGPAVEDRMGHLRYLFFYLGCGIAASFAHAFINPDSEVPALGASGAIAGVLGCYMRLFPTAQVVVLVPVIFIPLFFELPAAVFAGFWFLMQLLQGTAEILAGPAGRGSVAFWAHVGGFVVGFLLAPVLHQPTQRHRVYYADEGVLGFDPSGRL